MSMPLSNGKHHTLNLPRNNFILFRADHIFPSAFILTFHLQCKEVNERSRLCIYSFKILNPLFIFFIIIEINWELQGIWVGQEASILFSECWWTYSENWIGNGKSSLVINVYAWLLHAMLYICMQCWWQWRMKDGIDPSPFFPPLLHWCKLRLTEMFCELLLYAVTTFYSMPYTL